MWEECRRRARKRRGRLGAHWRGSARFLIYWGAQSTVLGRDVDGCGRRSSCEDGAQLGHRVARDGIDGWSRSQPGRALLSGFEQASVEGRLSLCSATRLSLHRRRGESWTAGVGSVRARPIYCGDHGGELDICREHAGVEHARSQVTTAWSTGVLECWSSGTVRHGTAQTKACLCPKHAFS